MIKTPSPDLFIRADGQSMAFLMGPTGFERQQVKQLVEAGGGVILNQPTLAYRDYIIRLLVRTEIPIKKDQDMFDYKYIIDCVDKDELLDNLIDYRISSHVPSIFEHYNPVDILQGILKWSDVPKKPTGERVSDIEDEEVGEDMRRSFEAEYRHHKAHKLPYCKKEQQEMVDWIVKYSAFKLVKGNLVWQRMEEAKVGRGRSWQSLKEHFRKGIIGQIHTFGLSRVVVNHFKVGMGLQEEVLTSGTECETREKAEARIKLVGIRPLGPRAKTNRTSTQQVNRSRSSSNSPPPSDQTRRRMTRGKVSKVPADKFDCTASSSAESDHSVPPPPVNRLTTDDIQNRNKSKIKQPSVPSSSKRGGSGPVSCSPKLVDVGHDAELEQLLDLSVLPPHLGDKFPSSESEGEVRAGPARKRKLFSDTYLDSLPEEEDMFALTPAKRRGKSRSKLEVTQELPSTEQFLEGLKEAASVELSREDSTDGIASGVTSTQKGLDVSGDIDEQLAVSDEVFDGAELNLVISESGGSSEVPLTGSGKAPSGTPSPSQSLNLLDPGPLMDQSPPDPSTYTLTQAVTDMENIPMIGYGSQNNDEVDKPPEEPVNTQGLVDALSNLGSDLPGLRPMSRDGTLTHVGTPPPRADIAEVVNSSLPDEMSDNPPNEDLIVGSPPQQPPKKSGRPLPTLRRASAPAQHMVEVAKATSRGKAGDDDVFDFSDHEDALEVEEVETEEAPAPAKTRGTRARPNLRTSKSSPYWDSLQRRGEGVGRIQRANKKCRAAEAHVGLTRGGEALLVVAGLPSDVDSEDIELVRTNKAGRGVRKFSERVVDTSSDASSITIDEQSGDKEDNVVRRLKGNTLTNRERRNVVDNDLDNPRPGPSKERGDREGDQGRGKVKYKLKVVSIGKENFVNKSKSGRFVREGEFSDRFRLPYTKREEQALVNYFLEQGGFRLRKGNKVWTDMESMEVCPGRTWQSMKQRWEKYISKTLDKFGVTTEELAERDVREGSEVGEDDETDGSLDVSTMRGYRGNANYYTNADDLKILDYIVQNKRFTDVGGNGMWEVMVKRGVIPGRSFHSLKERFRRVIIKKIRTYGLSEETVSKFLSKTREERLNTV
eukprot:TRINITY_DN25768_c0_g1_i1.p1 TRINITY_DN25768_c0_g1~~TRINITY_DN25768_c0_g1_i1.p1  ORF type:complete len:1107 (-),score=385.74 TRINITY_DN25768_c0_g1_i1:97-3417(-)